MLAVYDLRCNGMREPRGVVGAPRLSWRLGTDKAATTQSAYRVTVTSMGTGEAVWDSGVVRTSRAEAQYAGKPLDAAERYVWFVTVWDNHGEQAYGTPSAFLYEGEGACKCEWAVWPPQRRGMVWTSDDRLNDAVEEASGYEQLVGTDAMCYVWDVGDDEAQQHVASNKSSRTVERAWRDVVGLAGHASDFSTLRIELPGTGDLEFAQGTLLLDQGLLVIRWELIEDARRLQVSIPPGVRGTLLCGSVRNEVVCGQHVLYERINSEDKVDEQH